MRALRPGAPLAGRVALVGRATRDTAFGLALGLALAAGGVTSAAGPPAARPGFDACALLTSAEIEEVLGEPVLATKSGTPEPPASSVSQCFYILATFANSVSLEVTRADRRAVPSGSATDRWMRMFHEPLQGEDAEEAVGKGLPAPRPVEGVGDEAFWVRNGVMGTLYVLRGDAYLRISIGGSGDTPAKIGRSSALARRALQRL